MKGNVYEGLISDSQSLTKSFFPLVDVLSCGVRHDNWTQMILRDWACNILTISTACIILTPKCRAQLVGFLSCEGYPPCSVVGCLCRALLRGPPAVLSCRLKEGAP